MKKDSRRTLSFSFLFFSINRGFTNLEGVCSFFLFCFFCDMRGKLIQSVFQVSDGADRVPGIQHSANCSPFYPPLLSSFPSSSHPPPYLRVEGKRRPEKLAPRSNDHTVGTERGRLWTLSRVACSRRATSRHQLATSDLTKFVISQRWGTKRVLDFSRFSVSLTY